MNEPEHDGESEEPDGGAPRRSLTLDRGVWAAWWAGTILIVLSWASVVSPTVGWIGFGIACASALVSVVAKHYWRFPGGAG